MRLKIPEYRQFFRFPDAWTLYQLHVPEMGGSFLWQPFKLMLPVTTPHPGRTGGPRAYYLSWNPDEERLARSSHAVNLERTHPELYGAVLTTLEMTFDRDWLLGHYDTPEIAAERSRLAANRTSRSRARVGSKTQPATS